MALIHCPECNREISDQAVACPGCGYPIQKAAAPETEQQRILKEAREKDQVFLRKAGIGLFIGIILLLALVYFCSNNV